MIPRLTILPMPNLTTMCNLDFQICLPALHYKFVRNKLTLEPGVKLHYYHTKDTQLTSEAYQWNL